MTTTFLLGPPEFSDPPTVPVLYVFEVNKYLVIFDIQVGD